MLKNEWTYSLIVKLVLHIMMEELGEGKVILSFGNLVASAKDGGLCYLERR